MKIKTEKLQFKVAAEQRAAVDRVSAELGVTPSEFLRDAVWLATGVRDPLPKGMPRGTGRKRKRT